MTRLLFALGFFTALSTSLSAAPVPKVEPDPLPKGATARLGTNAFRGVRGMRPHGLSFTADSKKLIVSQQFGQRDDRQEFSVWDADTGKALVSKITPPAELKQSKKVFLYVRAVMLEPVMHLSAWQPIS